MTAYSFDRKELQAALGHAALLGARVRFLVDQRMTMTGRTFDQLRIVQELSLPESRIQVRKVSGMSLSAEYDKVGRSYKVDYLGQLHAKCLRVDNEALCGSVNWTTSSRGNLEMVVKMTLSDDGLQQFEKYFQAWWDLGADFTEADAAQAEAAALVERERRRTSEARSSSSR
jgi:phosphatidylserine/phosphatidylglycerophosphate/cardiolipin synthase-like enzyme